MSDEHCISEEALLQRLTEDIDKSMVEDARRIESKFRCARIYRVPDRLRKLKESAYTPRFISIGPFHSQDPHILNSPMQDVKKSYANSLFGRISSKEGGSEEEGKSKVLKECVDQMRKSLDKAKKCYADEVEDVLNEEMLVIDGCFILELLYRCFHKKIDRGNDPIFSSILISNYIQCDFILLENQLPFFVLNKLFNLTIARIEDMRPMDTLMDYVFDYFDDMWNLEKDETTTTTATAAATPPPLPPPHKKKKNYWHILDILHNHYSYHNDDAKPGPGGISTPMPCASDLDYAGVKFEVGGKVKFIEPQGRFPSRWFSRARFKIPTLKIYDTTEGFLRNLIAFEQCCNGVPCYFTAYADLMDTLINTTKDVRVLEKAQIIHNYLGATEDVSTLFNNLCKEIIFNESFFEETRCDAAQYSKGCWSEAMAHLRRRYFATPWTFIAFCAGFITFGISLFTFIRGNFH